METKIDPILDDDFGQHVIQSALPVLVVYTVDWCAPCKQFRPILEVVAQELTNKLVFYTMDATQNPVTKEKYDIRGYPCLMLFHQGQVIASYIGRFISICTCSFY